MTGNLFQVLNRIRYLDRAEQALAFIHKELCAPDGRIIRNYREGPSSVFGFADDYAFLIAALLDVYEVSGKHSYLKWAIDLQKKMDDHFWDKTNSAYFNAGDDDPTLVVRMKEEYDGAEPSPVRAASYSVALTAFRTRLR